MLTQSEKINLNYAAQVVQLGTPEKQSRNRTCPVLWVY